MRRLHVAAFVVVMALSFLFYGQSLDNPFWHVEDFEMLRASIQMDEGDTFDLSVRDGHHPLPLLLFLGEYRLFGLNPRGYYATNLVLHGLNAFLVYWLIIAMLPQKRAIAAMSGILFALGVGSYGKAVLFVAGAENLLITLLYLLILNLYIRNDRWERGRLLTWRYGLVLLLFLATSYAKPTAFSLIGGLLAYKFFFRGIRGENRRMFEPNLIILVLGAVAFWLVRELSGAVDSGHTLAGENPVDFARNFVRNFINYLVHMFFPIHMSKLVISGNPVVKAIYWAAPVIRWAVALSIVSYSLFGFVFGNRTIRFFLAWTLISILPYCAISFREDWLNIRYLYQTSIGFVFIMATGTVLSMDLLHRRKWRRLTPLLAPALFVFLSGYVTSKLDAKYERDGRTRDAIESRREMERLRAQNLGESD